MTKLEFEATRTGLIEPIAIGGTFRLFLSTKVSSGHEPRIILPARGYRRVATGWKVHDPGLLFVSASPPLQDLGVFVPGIFLVPEGEELILPLHHAGLEPFYLSHGDWIATLYRFQVVK